MKKNNSIKSDENKSEFDFRTIKNFEDACLKENFDPNALPDVSKIPEEFREAIINVYKLFVEYKAINNGKKANWNNGSNKYFPWFRVASTPALSSGSGVSHSYFGYDYSGTSVSSRLCTDSSEKAIYMASQFEEEYKKFFLEQ